MKLIAVEGCTLSVEGGVATVIPLSSVTDLNTSVDNKKAYHSIGFEAVVGDYSGGGTIEGSTVYSTGNSLPFVVLGDSVTVTLYASQGRTMPATIKVSQAGQSSTYAE